MKVKLSLMLLVMVLMCGAAFAQSVAGKWVGELSATDGHGVAQPITVELKLDGENVSGTVIEGALEPRPIMGASLEGAVVTFRTVRNFGGSDINVNWRGELKGEDLTLTREQGPAPADAAGGRGGGGRGGGGAAGGRGGGRGGAAAAGGQRGAAGAAVPPVPAPQANETPDAPAAAPAATDGAARGTAGRGGGAPAAGQAPGGRGAAAAPPAPKVTLTLHRAR
jgi:hypothetical protein